ncbi:putative NagD-like phosphatase [Alkalibacterium sp. AK22]|uniref:TIGR01457 family HAD-type hydrolase n=1 Tax=Alkalibacterium sp. AK22 TaxID=1229520 RepID=UPI00044E9724|nr:TIGR01457 family HAD-type hydrolase [Alkalibacterium sp. AK22]EXJ22923.1 putative NagD-like phosphatase [Alkalibacterium sp. AK22]
MADKSYKGYLIDLDGTMYKGKEKIEAAPGFIKQLKDKNIPYLFLTNNSTSSPDQVATKLSNQFGIQAEADEVYTSSLAAAEYIRRKPGNRVYVVGEKGLVEALESVGCELVEDQIDHVVVGLDTKLTYDKCEKASLAIQQGASFVATNKDTNLPNEKGLVPGAGSLVALIETATRVKPTFVGKPESFIMEAALERMGLEKSEVIMVGDNYETDILAGINNGIDALLVLTGFTARKDLNKYSTQPTHIIESLEEWDA